MEWWNNYVEKKDQEPTILFTYKGESEEKIHGILILEQVTICVVS